MSPDRRDAPWALWWLSRHQSLMTTGCQTQVRAALVRWPHRCARIGSSGTLSTPLLMA